MRAQQTEPQPRLAVIVTCHEEGPLVLDAVHSIQEPEPVEIVVIDDASRDDATHRTLDQLEQEGVRVIRLENNGGVAAGAHDRARRDQRAARRCRSTATTCSSPASCPRWPTASTPPPTPRPASATCSSSATARCCGRSRSGSIPTASPTPTSTPSPPSSAATRLEEVDGWRRPQTAQQGYEDWGLWMDIAERGWTIAHLGPRRVSYRRRLHGRRLNHQAREHHREIYRTLRASHPQLFADLPEHRRRSDLSGVRKILYPVVYGERARVPFEDVLKPIADRFGIWTLTRR